ncbi:MAG: hypothetical protein ACI4ON_00490 [Clostridia bacterium]
MSKIEVKKMGRPTNDPKKLNTRIRLSEKDVEKLNFCCSKTGKLKSEIIREGIDKVYTELNK